ncbi:MAG: tryptophan synthase beta chain [Neolewinella sp.]|jgi:tryptophan synthase beta chain
MTAIPKPVIPQVGAFGEYGGRYAPELLMHALAELAEAHQRIVPSREFQKAFRRELRTWGGRPTPLTEVPNFSRLSRLRVFLKREDLLHGGAHKTNNVIGQALLAKQLGKRRLVAETGAGQHGVATAMAGARHSLPVTVYMGARDMERQACNVARMKLCGAEVIPVVAGAGTLKEAIDDALRDWAATVDDSHYVLGTVCGPDPFPALVRDLQAVIGREARAQCLRQLGGLPDAALACVGGGSNAIGLFQGFLGDDSVKLFGAEPGGSGLASGRHGATLCAGTPGLLHGARSYMLQDEHGQVRDSYSIAAGLDYPAVGPEHAFLKDSGRAHYHAIPDDEAMAAVHALSRSEGILPAIESAHALALCLSAVDSGLLREGDRVVVNLSGRGDKDLATLQEHMLGGAS